MRRDHLELIRGFAGLDVLVIGEAMLDAYLKGSANRLCREAPVPVVALDEEEDRPGGAANTALNVASLGAHTNYLGVVGDDDEGRRLGRALESGGLSPEGLLASPGRRTLSKSRIEANGQMIGRLDRGDTEPLGGDTETALIERLVESHQSCDVLVVSDYGYGTITDRTIEALTRLQRRSPRPLIVDAKFPERYRNAGATAVKPNYGEVTRLLGLTPRRKDRTSQVEVHEQALLEKTGARIVAATLDEEGALVFERDAHPYRTYAHPMPHSYATGAGDTFTAAFSLALGAGADAPEAAECASAAARVVVSKVGTTVCTRDDLLGSFAVADKVLTERDELAERVAHLRRSGRRIVFTNGCFDILHRGHVTYLSRAKAFGDVLVVGVNADDQVRAQKGPGRPINVLEDRMDVLSALSCVDHIVAFEEPTPEELLSLIEPDVFVKGGDYTEQQLPEAPLVRRLGGRIELLPYLDGRSTSGIIERARREPEEEYPPVSGKSA